MVAAKTDGVDMLAAKTNDVGGREHLAVLEARGERETRGWHMLGRSHAKEGGD
jgi:hypothetical protein